jgi:predicted metal-binding transcription factor (methanogenesis marker protein 9)
VGGSVESQMSHILEQITDQHPATPCCPPLRPLPIPDSFEQLHARKPVFDGYEIAVQGESASST